MVELLREEELAQLEPVTAGPGGDFDKPVAPPDDDDAKDDKGIDPPADDGRSGKGDDGPGDEPTSPGGDFD